MEAPSPPPGEVLLMLTPEEELAAQHVSACRRRTSCVELSIVLFSNQTLDCISIIGNLRKFNV